MRLVECPVCKGGGYGYLEVEKYRGKIECPMCGGRGRVWVVGDGDKVWVEEMDLGYYIHRVGAVDREILDRVFETTVGEALSTRGKPVHFCEYCFGAYLVVNGEIRKGYP